MSDSVEQAEDEVKWRIVFVTKHGTSPAFVKVTTEEVERIRKELTEQWRKFIVIELDNNAGVEMVLRSDIVGFSVRQYR